jgi:hypothetical protein
LLEQKKLERKRKKNKRNAYKSLKKRFLLTKNNSLIDNMSYASELKELKNKLSVYSRAKREFYKIYKPNSTNPRLEALADKANNALDAAITLRTHIANEITRETPGYPKSDSKSAKIFDRVSKRITELSKERKGRRKRKLFKEEGIKEIEKTNKAFRERMKRIRDRQVKSTEMHRETPETAWWRIRGIKARAGSFKVRNLQRAKALENKVKKNWRTKSHYGLTTHLIGRIKSRRVRKMRP